MDGGLIITFISVAMFVGSFLFGFIPLLLFWKLAEQLELFVSILGAGLLCGTALAITIPEGVGLLEDSWKSEQESSNIKENGTVAERGPPRFLIGVALTLGFTFMFVVDQIGSYLSTHQTTCLSNSVHFTATLGLVIHAAPAAFGLVSFLMHGGLEKKFIQGHLLAFSAAAPIVAIATYFILYASGSSSENQLSATGVGMLFSAGTFLYVATVHVLPEISSSRTDELPLDSEQQSGAEAHQQRHLGLLESLTLIIGVGLPMLLALGLHDD
uniref:Zinc transporter ZIP9 n=1 Tax=Maylandia zebra TaxID=106582 RepID=A0A3P9BQE7_9CICH